MKLGLTQDKPPQDYTQNLPNKGKQDIRVEYQEDSDFLYAPERLSYINWIKWLAIFTIIFAIVQLFLCIIHLNWHSTVIAYWLLGGSIIFLIGGIGSIFWSYHAAKTYQETEALFQPRTNEKFTAKIFIMGMLLASLSGILIVNLFVQYRVSLDFVHAQTTTTKNWHDNFGEKTEKDLADYFKISFLVQSVFLSFHFFFFLLTARAAFKCLKWNNEAMSLFIFVANLMFFAAGLGLINYAEQAFGYGEYPQLKANFPVWNIKGLFVIGIAIAVISLLVFLVDHRSWKVGFFVLSFLVLVVLLLLASFTGYAYRHTRHVYDYYKGTDNIDLCLNRMKLIDQSELIEYGCPYKYLHGTECDLSQRVKIWEKMNSTISEADNNNSSLYCLNKKCCGILGEIYMSPFLMLSNYGFIAILGGCLVSIGCYYFWYIAYLEKHQARKKDYWWLLAMGWKLCVFLIVYFVVEKHYIKEDINSEGKHL